VRNWAVSKLDVRDLEAGIVPVVGAEGRNRKPPVSINFNFITNRGSCLLRQLAQDS
jgi:hypothetical protein